MQYLSQTEPTFFTGKRVLVRVDFNVPVIDGAISPDESFRIHAVMPTIIWLKNAGARIILLAHIGRSGDSLLPVAHYIQKTLPELDLQFTPEVVGEVVTNATSSLIDGQVLLLENVRKNPGEELNDDAFSKTLASYAEYYINDAFSVTHRSHASIVGIPQYIPSFLGLLIESEIHYLNQALQPVSPAVLIMAGIKFETKLPLIEKLLPLYDHVILGGGLLNTYLKARDIPVGVSVIDATADLSSVIGNEKIIIPEMVIVERGGVSQNVPVRAVIDTDVIVDVVISEMMKEMITNAHTVVWNGPLGWYEKGYMQSTLDIVASFNKKSLTIVGGGDTVTVLKKTGLDTACSFLSTGGGAMLSYLQEGTLVGIQKTGE